MTTNDSGTDARRATRGDDTASMVGLSAVLTGFEEIELVATGCAAAYDQTLYTNAPPNVVAQMLATWDAIDQAHHGDLDALEKAVHDQIWTDPTMGPVAQSLTLLWYLGSWFDATHPYGSPVSADSIREALVWPAVGAHPQGAKPTGFGTWALPPTVLAPKLVAAATLKRRTATGAR